MSQQAPVAPQAAAAPPVNEQAATPEQQPVAAPPRKKFQITGTVIYLAVVAILGIPCFLLGMHLAKIYDHVSPEIIAATTPRPPRKDASNELKMIALKPVPPTAIAPWKQGKEISFDVIADPEKKAHYLGYIGIVATNPELGRRYFRFNYYHGDKGWVFLEGLSDTNSDFSGGYWDFDGAEMVLAAYSGEAIAAPAAEAKPATDVAASESQVGSESAASDATETAAAEKPATPTAEPAKTDMSAAAEKPPEQAAEKPAAAPAEKPAPQETAKAEPKPEEKKEAPPAGDGLGSFFDKYKVVEDKDMKAQ